MTIAHAQTIRPEVEERALAIALPEMFSEGELPTRPLASFWAGAQWEGIYWALRNGKVVVLSVESGEVEGVKAAAMLECGREFQLLYRHDIGKGRLYLQKANADAATTACLDAARGSRIEASATCPSWVSELAARIAIDDLRLCLSAVAQVTRIDIDIEDFEDDRDGMTDTLCEIIASLSHVEQLQARTVLYRHMGDGEDNDTGHVL